MARYCEVFSGKDWRNCAFSFLRIHIRNLSNEHDHGALSAKLCSIPSYENSRNETQTRTTQDRHLWANLYDFLDLLYTITLQEHFTS